MRMPGWCPDCRKIRQVKVTRPRPIPGPQQGICAQCEDEQERDRFRLNRARTSPDPIVLEARGERWLLTPDGMWVHEQRRHRAPHPTTVELDSLLRRQR